MLNTTIRFIIGVGVHSVLLNYHSTRHSTELQ